MSSRLLAFLAPALFLVAACDSAGPDPDLADGPILPLATGNAWVYESAGDPPFRLEVGAPAEVDGEPYFRLVVSEGGQVSDEDEYVRAVGEGAVPLGAELLYTAPLGGGELYREATVYRYPVAEGTYEAGGRSYTVVRERVTVPAGTFEVVTYSGYDGDPTVSASFAPGVGIVRFFDGQSARELVSYQAR